MRKLKSRSKRIGIYSGTFNPVHTGHITFALQAIEEAKLDKIYFLPERKPRNKSQVEHFAHRVAMIKQAIRPHPKFNIIELTDPSFSVKSSLPKLQAIFPNDQLVFLIGSDAALHMNSWPNIEKLLRSSELVIGLRDSVQKDLFENGKLRLLNKSKKAHLINCYLPNISSTKVREALVNQVEVKGILKSVKNYSNKNWLYISLSVDNK